MTSCVSDFVNAYVGDGLRWAVSPVMNPAPNEQSPAVAKFRIDLEKWWKQFTYQFSISLRDYLAMAAFGEAQYAADKANLYIVELPTQPMHGAAYSWCPKYAMSEWAKGAQVFNHPWGSSGGYGGPKWFDIFNHAAEWQKHNDAGTLSQWIDWIADIEHNGGALFNKDTPSGVLRRDMDKSQIKHFLDWKLKAKNIPLSIPTTEWSMYVRQPARILVERYLMLWKGQQDKAHWHYPVKDYMQTAPVPSPVVWGNKVFTVAKTSKGLSQGVVVHKTETKKYQAKALSNGVSLEASEVGGIPESLKLVMGKLWMYAIVNDGKEQEDG